MAELVADCARCGASRTTFDIYGDIFADQRYGWQSLHEVFARCRHCHRGMIFKLALINSSESRSFTQDGSITSYKNTANDMFRVEGAITIRDAVAQDPPEMVPEPIAGIFREGSSSLAASCFNAAGSMFRLVLDLTTKGLILNSTSIVPQPTNSQRGNLAARLEWLFDNNVLPKDVRTLATCVKDDGNDAAHDGTLTSAEAEDLLDFAAALLERTFTEPGRLTAAEKRRDTRRRELTGK